MDRSRKAASLVPSEQVFPGATIPRISKRRGCLRISPVPGNTKLLSYQIGNTSVRDSVLAVPHRPQGVPHWPLELSPSSVFHLRAGPSGVLYCSRAASFENEMLISAPAMRTSFQDAVLSVHDRRRAGHIAKVIPLAIP